MPKKKSSKFNFNPRYLEGYQKLQGVQGFNASTRSAMMEPYNSGDFKVVSTDYAPDLTEQEQHSLYPQLDENAESIGYGKDQSSDESWYEKVFDWAKNGAVEDFSTLGKANAADTWRLTAEKKYQSHLSSIESRLHNTKDELEDVDELTEYYEALLNLSDMVNARDKIKHNVDPSDDKFVKFERDIKDQRDYVRTLEDDISRKWRNSDTFLRTFIDYNKVDNDALGFRFGLESLKTKHHQWDPGIWGGVKGVVGTGLDFIEGLGEKAALSLYGIFSQDRPVVRNTIKNSDPNNEYVNSLFLRSSDADGKELSKRVSDIKPTLEWLTETKNRTAKEQEADLISTMNTLKNGNWAFDPRKIDPEYKKAQQEGGHGVLSSLVMGIPEMGSSYSDLETFATMMGTETAAAYAGRYLLGGAEGKAAKVGRALLGAATTGYGAYSAVKLREEETGSEVSDAYASRLVDALTNDRNIDAEKVLNAIDRTAKSIKGVQFNTDELDMQEKMSLALAYNIKTGDETFDDLCKQARSGLSKVYNENMSLSTLDYLQMLPYMNYSRSVIGEVLKTPLAKAGDKITSTKIGAALSKGGKKIANIFTKAGEVSQALSDRLINKTFGTAVEDTYKRLRAAHAVDWIKKQAKRGLLIGASEGIEEGQQQLLQSRYGRGEYDNYDESRQIFSIPAALNDLDLAGGSLLAYFGLKAGDPDNGDEELRKAMRTGATTGLLFHGLNTAVISNLVTGEMNPENLWALRSQFKNDKVLQNIIGNNYTKAQDDAHIATFMRAMDKTGKNARQLEQSLNTFKRFKGELVTDEYIDNDIKLLRTTNAIYNSPILNDNLDAIHVARNSDDHVRVVQNAVRAIVDYDTVGSKVNQQNRDLQKAEEDAQLVVDNVLNAKDEDLSDEQRAERDRMKPLVDAIVQNYTEYAEELRQRNEQSASLIRNDQTVLDKIKHELNYDKRKAEAGNDAEKLKALDDEVSAKLDEVANSRQESIPDQSKYVKLVLSNIFAARRLEQVSQILKLFTDRQDAVEHAQREFGIDLNADRLASVIDNMKKRYDELKAAEKQQLAGINDAIDKLNAAIESKNREISRYNSVNKNKRGFKKRPLLQKKSHVSLKTATEKFMQLTNGMFDEYDKLTKSIFVNQSFMDLIQPYRNAYMLGVANPGDVKAQLRPIKWSELSKEQQAEFSDKVRSRWSEEGKDLSKLTDSKIKWEFEQQRRAKQKEISELVDRQTKTITEYNSKSEEDRTVGEEVEFNHNMLEIQRKAAENLIARDLADKHERQRIAHKEFLKDGGLTNDDIDNAENGDEQSRQDVEDTLGTENEPTQSPSEEQAEQDDEHNENEPGIDDIAGAQVHDEDSLGIIADDESGLYDTEDSVEDIIDDELDAQAKKRSKKEKKSEKPTEKKPVTKEEIADDTEKPGTKAAQEADKGHLGNIPTGEEDKDQQQEGEDDTPSTDNDLQPDLNTVHIIDGPSELTSAEELAIRNVVSGQYSAGDVTTIPTGTYSVGTASTRIVNFTDSGASVILRVDVNSPSLSLPSGYISQENSDEEIIAVVVMPGTNEHPGYIVSYADGDNNMKPTVKQGVIVDPENDAQLPENETPQVDKTTGVPLPKQDDGDAEFDEGVSEDNSENGSTTPDTDDQQDNDEPESGEQGTDNQTNDETGSLNTGERHATGQNNTEEEKKQPIVVIPPASPAIDPNGTLDVTDDGNVTVNGVQIPSEYTQEFFDRLAIMSELDYGEDPSEDVISELYGDDEFASVQSSSHAKRDYLPQTFFYNNTATEPMKLVSYGKEVKLKYDLAPGVELAKKLTQNGWFDSVQKFYVVTTGQNQDAKSGTQIALKDGDEFTVCLVMYDHDEKKAYCAALRQVGSHNYESEGVTKTHDSNQKLIHDLEMIGVNRDLFNQRFIEEVENMYRQSHSVSSNRQVTREEWSQYYESLDKSTKRRLRTRLRKICASGKAEILSYDEIDRNIRNLKKNRDEIIAAYCTKTADGWIVPQEVREDVVPKEVKKSNGKITSIPREENEAPKYRNITGERSVFGLPGNIHELDSQIKSGRVQFGFGKGTFGTPSYGICSLDGNTIFENGKGYAGKIYIIYNGVPVMLHEQRFNTIVRRGKAVRMTNDNYQSRINPTDGTISTSEAPSAAEFLLYLVTGKLNKKYYPNSNKTPEITQAFADLFVHNGEKTTKTIAHNNRSVSRFGYYANKMFSWDFNERANRYELTIALDDEYGNTKIRHLSESDLFSDTPDSANIRKQVVMAIAEHMHWNTDVNGMSDPMSSSVMDVLENYFSANPSARSFTFCGIPQFTFNKSDLFSSEGGVLMRNKTSLLSWMLTTGRIDSDVVDGVFKDPFIFAQGVSQTPAKKAVKQAEAAAAETKPKEKKPTPPTPGVIDITNTNNTTTTGPESFNKEKVSRIAARLGAYKSLVNLILLESPEDVESMKSQNTNPKVIEKGGLKARLILDLTMKPGMSDSAIQDAIEAKVKAWAKENNVDISSITHNNKAQYKNLKKNKALPYVVVYNNGTVSTFVYSTDSVTQSLAGARGKKLTTTQYGATGVYSKEGGHGTMNEQAARKWLSDTLGISDEHIIVQNGVFEIAKSGEAGYGMVTACAQSLGVDIALSRLADAGVEFHEAWHYVNLLLHSQKRRAEIYEAYVNKHPEAKNLTYGQIEELLADEFKKYMLRRTKSGLTGVIYRAFDRIRDFCNVIVRNKDSIRTIFRQIEKGKYKESKENKASLQQFMQKYGGVVMQSKYSIPTVTPKAIDGFKYVDSYQKFYSVSESLANIMMDKFAITRFEDLRKFSGADFNSFIDELMEEVDNEDVYNILEDVKSNPQAFFKIVRQAFRQYGIDVKIKRLKQVQAKTEEAIDDAEAEEKEAERQDAIDEGERPDNEWDVFQFGTSKKDNVANRAKLFLSHVRLATLEIDEENPSEKVLAYAEDEFLGSPVYIPFGQAWTKILSDLWNIESYGDIDSRGEYKSTSLRGKVKRLAKNSAFYRVLDQRLDDLDGCVEAGIGPDIELQNQIYATVKSQKAQMAAIWIDVPKTKYTADSDALQSDPMAEITQRQNISRDEIDDTNLTWSIQNDNALRAKRTLPREWSNAAMLTGLIDVNQIGETSVNKVFAKHVGDAFADIERIVTNSKRRPNKNYPKNDTEFNIATDDVIGKLVDLLNYMGIQGDEQVIEAMISNYMPDNAAAGDPSSRFKALSSIVTNTKDQGSLKNIVLTITKSAGKPNLTVGKGYSKDISKVYQGFKDDSWICRYAQSYNDVYPRSSDFSVKGPDGSMHYPVSQNNTMSDLIRQLNIDKAAVLMKMQSPYAANSVLFRISKNIDETVGSADQFVLNCFIGMKDVSRKKGGDYFNISYMEDYLAKLQMTLNNMMVLPTMADKKTWYSIQHRDLKMPHDLITWDKESEDGSYNACRFSDNTLDIFVGYFLDELNSLKQYYSRENIAYLVSHPNALYKNFHGNVKKGRMDFSGNGGLFRYMYGLDFGYGNLNQYLQGRYELQKKIEANPVEYGGIGTIREGNEELDGFELVRQTLSELEALSQDREAMRDRLNKMLFERVNNELRELSTTSTCKLAFSFEDNGMVKYMTETMPSYLLDYYYKQFKAAGLTDGRTAYNSGSNMKADLTLSVIANHVAATAISVIEMEKVFSGDPAFYKYKYKKAKRHLEMPWKVNEKYVSVPVDVSILNEKDTDKIKRLGALLSPGQNIRLDYSRQVTNDPKLKSLNTSKYTVLNICDFNAKSMFLNEASDNFARQTVIDTLRGKKKLPWLDDYVKSRGFKNADDLFTHMYMDINEYKKFADIKNHDEKYKDTVQAFLTAVNSVTDMSVAPYNEINVSDAQVIIRPELYRKIRIGLGQWSFEEDEDGYSDEKAFEILEKDGSWMHDEEKARLVSKLELFPLKMSYFQNDPNVMSSSNKVTNMMNLPIYDKMAIFPMFKYMTRSEVGKQLYDRMNRESDPIDMLAFESAVKVGDKQNKYRPYKNVETGIGEFNSEDLTKPSDKYIDANGNVAENTSEGTLAISVQDLSGLRMQLNTDAHKAMERFIGSQMFKLAYSNVRDNDTFGYNRFDKDGKPVRLRKGRDIKHDIMSCINALTSIGERKIAEEFGIKNGVADRKKVADYANRITKSNGLGVISEEIMDNRGIAASLQSRRVFEQSAIAVVNGEVIKINTPGGTAVQQSIFGLTGYDKSNIETYEDDKYHVYNEGKNLEWSHKNGTVEVLLSINLFRQALPPDLRDATYEVRRQWLIDNDIVKGKKSDGTYSDPQAAGIGYRIPTQGMSSMFAFVVADVINEQSGDLIVVPQEFTAQTGSDFDVDKIFITTRSYTNGVLNELSKDEKSKMIDIYQNKDIRNKETAITELLKNANIGAVQNRLIDDYIAIITDECTYSNARASIDVITAKIKDELLPLLRQSDNAYKPSGYELSPMFQLRRKMEFTTGKSGIGAFALNVTNMTLTQYAHLTMYYTANNPFKLGDLDMIIGQDGLRISDWLSAMVNAHVDVAKDPYIFDMNINSCTYNMTNFLIRAGKGLSTFTFIAQPAIKAFADLKQQSNSIYGNNLNRGKKDKSGGKKQFNKEWEKVYSAYIDILKSKVKEFKEAKTDVEFIADKKYIQQSLAYFLATGAVTESTASDEVEQTTKDSEEADGKKKAKIEIDYSKVFDLDYAKKMFENPNSIEAIIHQLVCLRAWANLTKYADEMSQLVKASRIDTEKFGNTYAAQINFKNTYNRFKYGNHKAKWYIKPDIDTQLKLPEIKEVEKQKGLSYALRKYFGGTFLDSKFYAATTLARMIMRGQLFTATDSFESLFMNLMSQINESAILEVEKPTSDGKYTTTSLLSYKPVTNEDLVESIAHAIDNIARYKILEQSQPLSYNGKDFDYDTEVGPIDFTCGGDKAKVKEKFAELLWGEKPKEGVANEDLEPDIFKRTSDLISELQHVISYGDDEYLIKIVSSGLINAEGKITNPFLLFLRPQTASAKFPLGRMLMAKSTFTLTGTEEAQLMSGFNELLQCPLESVRKLARDLVFYAYYSSYDQNAVHSFFHLVPPYYRRQYDSALATVLRKNKSAIDEAIGIKDGVGVDTQFVDPICRNYWTDDNVVPVKIKAKTGNLSLGNSECVVYQHNDKIQPTAGGKNKFHGGVHGIFLSKAIGDSPYVKVQYGDDYYLYKNIGYVTESGEMVNPISTAWQVYAIVPKLGLHSGSIHQYEFSETGSSSSIYSENNLDEKFRLMPTDNYIGMLGILDWYLKDSSEKATDKDRVDFEKEQKKTSKKRSNKPESKPENKGKEGLTAEQITHTFEFHQREGADLNYNNYRKSSDSLTSSSQTGIIDRNDTGDIRFLYTNDVDKSITGNKDSNNINLDFNGDIEEQIQQFTSQDSESTSVSLNIVGNLKEPSVSDSAVEGYISQMASDYRVSLLSNDPNMNHDELEKKVDAYKDSISKDDVKDVISQALINKKVFDVLDTIASIKPIFTINCDGSFGVGYAAALYAMSHKGDTVIGGQPAYVYIDKKYQSVKNRQILYSFIDGLYSDAPVRLYSDEEYQQLSAITTALDNFNQAEEQLIEDTDKRIKDAHDIQGEEGLGSDETIDILAQFEDEGENSTQQKSDDKSDEPSSQEFDGDDQLQSTDDIFAQMGIGLDSLTDESSDKKDDSDAKSKGC